MNFPVWDVGFGLPLLIALVAIPHVVVAHFAIGGGLFLVVYESRARRLGDAAMLGYVRRHSRFFMLLTLVMGAMTGVGIWFTIGLIHPAATSALIHAFIWFWATEWVMFFVEIAASLVYYYGWDRLDAKTHQRVMWIYFIAAWGSLVVINGIITFMLTSGSWPQDRNIWSAFFNATYLPSLIFRTLLTFLMAGIFAFVTAAWQKDDGLRRRITPLAALWSLPSLLLLIPVAFWYRGALPASIKATMAGGWAALTNAQSSFIVSAIILAVAIIVTTLHRSRLLAKPRALLMVVCGMALFGSFEWTREAARKPYVIGGYMYSNGLLVSDTTSIRQAGLTESIKWKHDDPSRQGEDLFRATCQSCHSLTGYSGLAAMVAERGWNSEQLSQLIPRIGYMRGAMPPFMGTATEARLIAEYVAGQAKSLKSASAAPTPDQIWSANCGLCHTIDGHRPLRGSLAGMKAADLKETILTAGELSEAMPPFLGTDADVGALALHIEKLLASPAKEGGK